MRFNTFTYDGDLYEVHFNCGRPCRIVQYSEGKIGRVIESVSELPFLLQTEIESWIMNHER